MARIKRHPPRTTATILEDEPGSGHQVLDGLRHEHLPWRRSGTHARSDVHGYAADVVPGQLALAGVQSRPQLEPERAHPVAQVGSAADRAARPVESRQEAVAEGLHLAPSVAVQARADEPVVLLHEVAPAAIAERRG